MNKQSARLRTRLTRRKRCRVVFRFRRARSSQGAAASVATDQRIPRLTIVFLRNERHVFRPPQKVRLKKHEQAQAVSCCIWRALSELAMSGSFLSRRISEFPRLTIVFLRNERHVFSSSAKVRLKRIHEQAQAVSCFRIWRALRSSQGAAAFAATDQRIPRV